MMYKTALSFTHGTCLFFCFSWILLAQISTGNIVGTVHDESGAVAPGVNVTIRRVETNETVITRTNCEGD